MRLLISVRIRRATAWSCSFSVSESKNFCNSVIGRSTSSEMFFHPRGRIPLRVSDGCRGISGKASFRDSCQHHTVLNLILILLEHLEEVVDAMEVLVSFPKCATLLVCQLIVRGENREIELIRIMNQFIFHSPIFSPRQQTMAPSYTDNERLALPDVRQCRSPCRSFAYGAGTDRRVEREHLIVRLLKSDAVRFEFRAETI